MFKNDLDSRWGQGGLQRGADELHINPTHQKIVNGISALYKTVLGVWGVNAQINFFQAEILSLETPSFPQTTKNPRANSTIPPVRYKVKCLEYTREMLMVRIDRGKASPLYDTIIWAKPADGTPSLVYGTRTVNGN